MWQNKIFQVNPVIIVSLGFEHLLENMIFYFKFSFYFFSLWVYVFKFIVIKKENLKTCFLYIC